MGPARIVVADDDEEIRTLVLDVLEEAGYRVAGAGDGLSALTIIRTTRPDLALLDIAMPVMTGDEALQQLRAEGPALPVVIMTAGTDPGRFLGEGAAAVLPKPFELDQLLATIAHALAPLRERHVGA